MAEAELDRLIRNAEDVVDAAANDPEERQASLTILWSLASYRYNTTKDLPETIRVLEKAVRLTPDSRTKAKMTHLNNLSYFLFLKYQKFGAQEDLQRATAVAQRVVNATASEDPQLPQTLDLLASMLAARFTQEDLENAIKISRRAIRLTPRTDDSFPLRLCKLVGFLSTRHNYAHRLEDLDEAIRFACEAKSLISESNPLLPDVLLVLSQQYRDRFTRERNIDDLTLAIKYVERAISLLPEILEDGRDAGPFYDCLSTLLSIRFFVAKSVRPADCTKTQIAKDLELLEAAVQTSRNTVNLTPKDSSDRLIYMDRLSNSLADMFDETDSISFLEESIRVQREMISLTPSSDAHTTELLDNFGMKLEKRFKKTGNAKDLEEALSAYLNSFRCTSGRPWARVSSARRALRLLIKERKLTEAWEVSISAVKMLPLVNRRSLKITDKRQLMGAFSGVAALACSLSIELGHDVLETIDTLEIGRSAVLGHEIDARSDFVDLSRDYPVKASRFDRLRKVFLGRSSGSRSLEQHIKDDEELEHCINEIRALAGFERFMMTPSIPDLQRISCEGPIVIVNVSYLRSDTIVISPERITVLPLPTMGYEKTLYYLNQNLTDYTAEDCGRKNREFVVFQSWLWKCCVSPIISFLEIQHSYAKIEQNLPRTWWIGTGYASSLPFHAAGDNSPGCLENTFSHVVSSYVPTIKALVYARERFQSSQETRSAASPKSLKLLAIAMPTTPGQEDLESAQEEITNIDATVKQRYQVTTMLQPSASDVLELLPQFEIVHFACHGESDTHNPLESFMILQKDGTNGGGVVADHLKVGDIARIDLKHAQLAYLSACSTAESRVWDLKDEVIYMSSSFLIAGYSHVVGAQWPMDEDVSVQIATKFYEHLAEGRGGESDAAARALYAAVDMVRSAPRMWKQPLAWAPFVHAGA